MTFLWLIVWLIYSAPALHQWNGWVIALIVCAVIDILEVLDKRS